MGLASLAYPELAFDAGSLRSGTRHSRKRKPPPRRVAVPCTKLP